MSDALVPCASCQRHVRASTDACPFCGAAHAPVEVPERPARARLSRAAVFALGATLGATGCETAVPLYGAPAPPLDASADVADVVDADADAVAVRYGAPPPPDAR